MARRPFEREEHRYRDAQRGQSGERGGWSERGFRGRGWGGGERGGQERGSQERGGQERGFAERFRQEDMGGDDYDQSSGYGYESQRGDFDFARDYPRYGQEQAEYGQRGRSGSNWRRGQTSMGGGFGETGSNDRGGFGQDEYAGSQGRYAGESGDFQGGGSRYGGQFGRSGSQQSGGGSGGLYGSRGWQGEGSAYGSRGWQGEGSDFGHGQFGSSHERGQFGYGRQPGGQFSGRGPRGYQRSDERIREEVCDMLTSDPDIDASEIEVKVEGGEIVLSGTVDDREQKRAAEDVAETVQGVNEVRNELRVKRQQFGQSHTGQSAFGTQGGQQASATQSGQQAGGKTGEGAGSSATKTR